MWGAFSPSCGCQVLALEAHRWVLAPLPSAKPHHGPRGRRTAHQHGSDFSFLVLEYTPFILLSLAMYFQLYFKKLFYRFGEEGFCVFP